LRLISIKSWRKPAVLFCRKEGHSMSTAVPIGSRFKTGQTSPVKGQYQFDGYLDGTSSPAPTADEKNIPLDEGKTFPPIKSSGKACWWELIRKL